MSRFAPVHLPEDRRLNDRASQTFLRHFNLCPRSGYLYALTRGQARTMEMERGRLLHAAAEQMTRLMIEQGEVTIPPEIAKVIVDELFADPEFAVPVEEHDYLREAVYRLASEWAVDPQTVVAVETLFALDIDGVQVRAKIDFAEVLEEGAVAHVIDFKSARGAPPFEEVARKLPDGRLMARSFQLVLYALCLAFGVPVRVEPCGECEGLGAYGRFDSATGASDIVQCPTCEGRGRVEFPEPFPVASRAQRFDLAYVYPGIEDRDGKIVTRPVTLSRPELDQYLQSLRGLIARVRESERTGDWPAVVSDTACDQCPAASLCPIPAELRDHRGTINTPEQAAEALQVRARVTAEQRAIQRELRTFVEHNGPVRFGNGMVAEVAYSEHEEVFDKDGMFEAVERAALYGEPFERWRYVRTKGSNRFKERELTADELAGDGDAAS